MSKLITRSGYLIIYVKFHWNIKYEKLIFSGKIAKKHSIWVKTLQILNKNEVIFSIVGDYHENKCFLSIKMTRSTIMVVNSNDFWGNVGYIK